MERLRSEMFNLVEDPNNDGADLGTACHSAAEDVITSMMGGGKQMTLDDTYDAMEYYWDRLSPHVDNWHSYGTAEKASLNGRGKIKNWYENVMPMITDPQGVEVDFNKILIEDDERVVYVRGTIDLVESHMLWDWKFPKADYTRDRWQYDRWDVQSIAYTWAMGIPYFRFGVMHNKGWGTMDFLRNDSDYEWLRQKVASMCQYVENQTASVDTPWLLGDNGWWCSEKWCPNWTRCKGKSLEREE